MCRSVAGDIGITVRTKSEVGDAGSLLSESDDTAMGCGAGDIVL